MSIKWMKLFVIFITFYLAKADEDDYESILENPYRVLEIAPWSSMEVVRKRYNELAKKSHPDMKSGSSSKFMKIQSAYEQIKSARKLNDEDDSLLKNIFFDFLYSVISVFSIMGSCYLISWACFKFFEYIWKFVTTIIIAFLFIDKFLPHFFKTSGSQTMASIALGLILYYKEKILKFISGLFYKDSTKKNY
jgi:hypothetical protein